MNRIYIWILVGCGRILNTQIKNILWMLAVVGYCFYTQISFFDENILFRKPKTDNLDN